MNTTLIETDNKLKYLLEQMSANRLTDKLNLIIVSDHGMSVVNKVINIGIEYNISQSEYYPWSWGGVMYLDASPRGREKDLYEKLKTGSQYFDTYYKHEVPARFNFGKNPRIGNIVLMPKVDVIVRPGGDAPVLTDMVPSVVNVLCKSGRNLTIGNFSFCSDQQIGNKTVSEVLEIFLNGSQTRLTGNHGYDNEHPLMEPIFIAYGPDFKKNHILNTIRQVDYYSLMTNLLDIVPQPHDGSFDNVKSALLDPVSKDSGASSLYPAWSALLVLAVASIWIRRNLS